MSILQVKNVPPAIAASIRRLAKSEGRTLSDVIVRALEREVQRNAFQNQLTTHKPVLLKRSASEILDEIRRERDEK